MENPLRRSPSFRIFTLLIIAVFFTCATSGPVQASDSQSNLAPILQSTGQQVIDPQVRQDLASGAPVDFWILLRQSANLSALPQSLAPELRSTYVFRSLTSIASVSQARIITYLNGHALRYESRWIVNAILVYGASQADLDALSAFPEVLQVLGRFSVQLDPSAPDSSSVSPAGSNASATTTTTIYTNWGLDFTQAPQVWNTLGDKGAGIVVANIDTGVMSTHPALVAQYRGTSTGSNDYNWYMPPDVAVPDTLPGCHSTAILAPCDDHGHGTHTMGIMVGDDGAAHQTGMAPQAKWIACKAFNSSGSALDSDLITCAQWVLAPTDVNFNNPDPTKAPDVVNNSWGDSVPTNPFFQASVQAWVAAGIFPAFSAGNTLPSASCSSVGSPGDYPETFAVGAVDSLGNIATWSNRGPVSFGVLKPDLVAPGVGIISTWNNGAYHLDSGTSMAAPHTAGAVALLWSAVPALKGNITSTIALLYSSANPNTPNTGPCGAPGPGSIPNYTYGYGYLDVYALVAGGMGISPSLNFVQSINPVHVNTPLSFSIRQANPLAGADYPQARFDMTFKNTSLSDIGAFEYDDGSGWQPVTLTQDGPDVTGFTGPSTGFDLAPGYAQTTSFRITWTRCTTYPVIFQLVDLSNQGRVLSNLVATAAVNPFTYILPVILNNSPWP